MCLCPPEFPLRSNTTKLKSSLDIGLQVFPSKVRSPLQIGSENLQTFVLLKRLAPIQDCPGLAFPGSILLLKLMDLFESSTKGLFQSWKVLLSSPRDACQPETLNIALLPTLSHAKCCFCFLHLTNCTSCTILVLDPLLDLFPSLLPRQHHSSACQSDFWQD